jgi:hypothetical protein
MNKEEIITFKADSSLTQALSLVPNRSDFIRGAILHALKDTCPLCQGTGRLSPLQKTHWDDFARHHGIKRCSECDEAVMTCDREGRSSDA